MITQCPKTGRTCEVTGCNGCWKDSTTQDEIIRMAREAGYQSVYLSDAPIGRSYQFLERFAALVAANEREKPVTVPANGLRQQEPSRSTPTGSQSNEIVPVGYVDAMFQFQTCQEHHVSPSDRFKPVYTAEQIEAAVLAEREACAKVCDEHGFYGAAPARDIRARGETK